MVLGKNSKGFGITPKTFGGSVAAFLKARHPIKTAAQVASDTGGACSPAQVEKWLDGSSAPSGPAFASLASAYGLEFLAAVLPPADWLDDARNRQQEAELLAQREAIERRLDAFYAARS
jgi:hypothetical protein